MDNRLLKIDVLHSKYKSDGDDLIKIKFRDDDVVQISFSKLVSQSKYIRDKYKYSEALNSFPTEIKQLQDEYNIKEESIKLFIQLILNDKVTIPIECYKDIYTLSEHFYIPKFTQELDDISQKKLFNDLNFTIQNLFDSETSKNRLETKLPNKIESFLSKRINECIKNAHFSRLPVSTIWRILDKSDNESVNHDLLIEFIFKSVETRFVLFKFIDMNRLSDNIFDEFIKFIDEQKEETKEKCIECLQFNLSFIKRMKNKCDEVSKLMRQTEETLEEEKKES